MSTLLHDKQVNIWYLLTIIIFLKDFIKNKWTKLFFTQYMYHNTYFSARKNFQKKKTWNIFKYLSFLYHYHDNYKFYIGHLEFLSCKSVKMIQWVTKVVNNKLCYINVKDSIEQRYFSQWISNKADEKTTT